MAARKSSRRSPRTTPAPRPSPDTPPVVASPVVVLDRTRDPR